MRRGEPAGARRRGGAGILAAALLAAGAAPLAAQAPARYALEPAATRVWFEAGSRLGAFRGDAREVRGWAEAGADLREARGRVEIDAARIETGIGLRDRHLREALEVERHPEIVFVLDGTAPLERTGGGEMRALFGTLTIRGATRAVAIPATLETLGDTLRVRGRLVTRFSEFGMEPPARLLGLARVEDTLVLGFDATFVAEP